MKRAEVEEAPESDAFAGAPHPRHATRLVGHRAAEAEMLAAYRDGRLAHAWLIGGPEGVGKATLAWRFARFLLANPDPAARSVREARDLAVDADSSAARQVGALAHPDFALIRREWRTSPKGFASEIGVDAVREAMQVFQLSAALGGSRIAIVDCAEDLNRSSANALLKVIEEPPDRSLILVVSHLPGQVLPTIRSRCRRLNSTPCRKAKSSRRSERWGHPGAKSIQPQRRTPPGERTGRSARRLAGCRRTWKGSAS